MSYEGDFPLGATLDIKFTTRRFSTGAPHTLAGTPSVAAYPDNSTTEITAGITLSVDFDSRTGLNNVRVVATGGNGYATGTSYALVITAGTVDSVSVVGEVVGSFTLERSAASGRLPAALVSGRIDASVGAMAANVLTASAIAADAITDAKVAADVTIASVTGAVGSVTGNVGGNVTGSIGSLGATAKADVNAEVVDALATDTYAEIGQEAPAATQTIRKMLGFLYKAFRNKIEQDATTLKIYNDAGSVVDQKATVSDSGSLYTRGEIGTGP